MSSSEEIVRQFSGVIPGMATGQNAVAKTYVDSELDKRDGNITSVANATANAQNTANQGVSAAGAAQSTANQAVGLANEAQSGANEAKLTINDHKKSTVAHSAESIVYNGAVQATDVKNAIDVQNERINKIVSDGGNSNIEIVDARGTFPILRDRLNVTDTQMAGKASQTDVTNLQSKTNERPGIVPRPNGFPWLNPPLIIKKDTFGRYTAIFDIEKLVPAYGKAYYVDITNGIDTNDGLTATTAFKSFFKALQQIDARIIYVAPGVYDRIRGWIKTNPASNTLIIKPTYKGDVVFGTHQDNLTWTADTIANVYKTPRTSVTKVYDSTVLDAYGDHTELNQASSISDVSITPGTWYTDGTTVYIHLLNGRVPDNTVKVYVIGGNGWVAGSKTIYMEGIKFYGGDNPFETLTDTSADQMKLYFKNCEFKYGVKSDGSANGLTIKGTKEVILQNCITSRNQRDGNNYHVYNNIVPNVIEIDCISYNNGLNDANTNNNGSTMHDAGNIIRINGTYFGNRGPNVVDVGGSNSWNLGCASYKSAAPTNDINYQVEGGTMWLDGCIGYDSKTDTSSVGTAKLYSRRSIMSNKLYETSNYS